MKLDDLKNIDLKNLNMQDIKEKILLLADKKTLIKIGVSLGSIIAFLIIYYAVLNPMVETRKAKLQDMTTKQEETVKFKKGIKSAKKKIKKLTPQYENYSTLFHSRAEVEGLYETLSEFAAVNGLVISKLSKGKPAQVSKSSALAAAEENTAKKKKKKKKKKSKKAKGGSSDVAYYKIPVNFEITGNFIGYIKFKRAVSLSKKMLNFDKESIKVVKSDSTGAIVVSGVLTIVGLKDEFL